jgi:uncharacterized SAM-binding protein YcdF (DUF218 family)
VLLLARALGVLAIAAALAAAFTPLPNVLARRLVTPDPPGPADAIVALAARAHADGTLSDDSLRRLVRALELYAEGRAPLLVLSGAPPRAEADEAGIRARLARRLGVPAGALLTLSRPARTTDEEARLTAALLGARGLERVLVVTDWTHAARARGAFRRAGLDARVAVTARVADAAETPGERAALAWACVREVLARVYYRLAGLA